MYAENDGPEMYEDDRENFELNQLAADREFDERDEYGDWDDEESDEAGAAWGDDDSEMEYDDPFTYGEE